MVSTSIDGTTRCHTRANQSEVTGRERQSRLSLVPSDSGRSAAHEVVPFTSMDGSGSKRSGTSRPLFAVVLRHCDETEILRYRKRSICLTGDDAGDATSKCSNRAYARQSEQLGPVCARARSDCHFGSHADASVRNGRRPKGGVAALRAMARLLASSCMCAMPMAISM